MGLQMPLSFKTNTGYPKTGVHADMASTLTHHQSFPIDIYLYEKLLLILWFKSVKKQG